MEIEVLPVGEGNEVFELLVFWVCRVCREGGRTCKEGAASLRVNNVGITGRANEIGIKGRGRHAPQNWMEGLENEEGGNLAE